MYCGKIWWKSFRQCGKDCRILYDKIRAGGEIGENFLLAKISMHTIYIIIKYTYILK